MECHDRADSDTSRGRDECLRVNTARVSTMRTNGSQATAREGQQVPPEPARTRKASRSASSPAEQREESHKRHTKAADTTHDGLSQRRSYGTKTRDEARNESAARADDESAPRHNSLDVEIEMSRQ